MAQKKKKGPAPRVIPEKKPPFWKRGSVPTVWKWGSIVLAVLLCVQGGFLVYHKENSHENEELLIIQTERAASFEKKVKLLTEQVDELQAYEGLDLSADYTANIELCDYRSLDFSTCGKADDTGYQKAMSLVCEKSKLLDYPDKMYAYFEQTLDDNFRMQYDDVGVTTLKAFLENSGYQPQEYIEQSILMEYAVYSIAAKEDLKVTQEDYDALLAEQGYDSVTEMAEDLGLEIFEIDSKILYDKVGAVLLK